MSKRYYCTVQQDVTGKIVLWGVGRTKKESEAEAAKWIENYCELADTPADPIYESLVTLPITKQTYDVVTGSEFDYEDNDLHIIDGKLMRTQDPEGLAFDVTHKESCAYVLSAYDLTVPCDCKAKFNGKPFSYWQEMALEQVVDAIIRKAENMDSRALPGALAKKMLLAIADDVSPEMVKRVYQEKAAFERGTAAVMAALRR